MQEDQRGLGNAFAAMTVPVPLILDDVHSLHNSDCRAALSALADHVPAGSRLVLAGREQPPLRVARLRAAGRIIEIGSADLALSREEAAALLRDAQVMLGEDDLTGLHQRTEGWAAGLYLAALSLREGGSLPAAAASFGGDHQFVSQYVESELLARISHRQRDTGQVDLPETGRRQAQPGHRPGPGARPPRGLRTYLPHPMP